jgi:hypothetical protein
MDCDLFVDSYIFMAVIIYNFLLLIPSLLLCDYQTLRNYPNNLPFLAGCIFFLTALVDYSLYSIIFDDHVIFLTLDVLTWTLDYTSRLCLLFYSMHRLKTLVDPQILLKYMIGSCVISFASYCFLLSASVFDPTFEFADLSLLLYSATDLLSLSLDLYLAYLVSKVGRAGQGLAPRLYELVTGPGLSILFGSIFCITSLTVTILERDPYYIYYTLLYILRIFMLQIFNIKLVLKMFKKQLKKKIKLQAKNKFGTRDIFLMGRKLKVPQVTIIPSSAGTQQMDTIPTLKQTV